MFILNHILIIYSCNCRRYFVAYIALEVFKAFYVKNGIIRYKYKGRLYDVESDFKGTDYILNLRYEGKVVDSTNIPYNVYLSSKGEVKESSLGGAISEFLKKAMNAKDQ